MRQIIEIEKPVFGGRTMGRLNGQTVFVSGAIAGETVQAEITRRTKDYCERRPLKFCSLTGQGLSTLPCIRYLRRLRPAACAP
jgi:tRNA/tmRNA/rRNA uracil-C5-methylase (TrmA/RlmC/RlmD family)